MRRNVYSYSSNLPLYAVSCDGRAFSDGSFDIAIGSFVQEYSNQVEIINYSPHSDSLQVRCRFKHLYPPTKVVFLPQGNDMSTLNNKNLLATAGEYLRIWIIPDTEYSDTLYEVNRQINQDREPKTVSVFSIDKNLSENETRGESCSPVTSIDWSPFHKNTIVASGVNGSCSIFDVEANSETNRFHLEGATYDISLSKSNPYIFCTATSHGLLKFFDMRARQRVGVYAPFFPDHMCNILRVKFNPVRSVLVAAISDGSNDNEVAIVDIRKLRTVHQNLSYRCTNKLRRHNSAVNAVSWAPHKDSFLCSVGEDKTALVWAVSDFGEQSQPIPSEQYVNEKPLLAYNSNSFAVNTEWSTANPSRIALVSGNSLELLKV